MLITEQSVNSPVSLMRYGLKTILFLKL